MFQITATIKGEPRSSRRLLYQALGKGLEVCDATKGQPDSLARVMQECANRDLWINATSDIFQRVVRLEFDGWPSSSVCRYALALREAARRAISGEDLPTILWRHRGIGYLVPAIPKTTTTLKLDRQIDVPQEDFALRLRPRQDGRFEVLA